MSSLGLLTIQGVQCRTAQQAATSGSVKYKASVPFWIDWLLSVPTHHCILCQQRKQYVLSQMKKNPLVLGSIELLSRYLSTIVWKREDTELQGECCLNWTPKDYQKNNWKEKEKTGKKNVIDNWNTQFLYGRHFNYKVSWIQCISAVHWDKHSRL